MATLADPADTVGPRYTKVAIWLHWLIGLAVIANIGLAMLTEDMPRETHRAAMDIHKALGITILALTIVRILWRVGHKPPPLPAATPAWQRPLSKIVHFLFYALLILLPLSGWVWMSAAGRPIDFFGLATIPTIAQPDEGLADAMHDRHEMLGLAMLALAAIHILAALKHQFIDRTGLIGRMNPF
ncbi:MULTISPECIES: cytochrome b [unclassified Sphingopyxis]|uniref:cytochrome b n=1 Tax=unclassified Sphingopyxis TaxID=2614943 RepID=UPI00285C0B5B|nr:MULTISPECIES: cytochrome b [unclassified Sphingopyxis]MDR6831982.1 cytochrome b561 [Sphingopyxis sp. BE122]MDR7227724.1 cytochrome b561 [Sphingopyxis sp. BE259]